MLLYSMVMAQNTSITLPQAVMFWCINREHTVIICEECFEPRKGKEKLGKGKEKVFMPDAIFTLQRGEKCNLQHRPFAFRELFGSLNAPGGGTGTTPCSTPHLLRD